MITTTLTAEAPAAVAAAAASDSTPSTTDRACSAPLAASEPDDPSLPPPAHGQAAASFSSPPHFPRSPGETPRAYGVFVAFFQLGHLRTHQAVADKLGENLGTIRNWSSRFDWRERVQSFNSGLLSQNAQTQADLQRRQAADWAARLNRFREQEWDAAQKLLAAAQCFLESFDDDNLRKMTLAQVSRALQVSSAIGRLALTGIVLPDDPEPAISPVQQHLLSALHRVYGRPPALPGSASPDVTTASTATSSACAAVSPSAN